MYTIINTELTKEGTQRVDLICDTVDDVPTADEIKKEFFAIGSFAYIANDRTYKVLNNAEEWV